MTTENPKFSQLPYRPLPKSGEGKNGFQLRLAQGLGLENPSWLDEFLDKKSRSEGPYARWCASCLAEPNAVWSANWEAGWPICMIHSCWLQDSCGACNQRMSWQKLRFDHCKHGHPLADQTSIALPKALVNLLWPKQTHIPEMWVFQIAPDRRIAIAHVLGALYHYGLGNLPIKRGARKSIKLEHNLLETGAEILLNGVPGFHKLLDRIRHRSLESTATQTMNQSFPTLNRILRKYLHNGEFGQFQEYLSTYVNTTSDQELSIVWRNQKNRVAFTKAQTAKILGIRHERIESLLAKNGIASKIRLSKVGRKMMSIDVQSIGALKTSSESKISMTAAAVMLGISRNRAKLLFEENMLSNRDGQVDVGSINQLLSGLRKLAKPLAVGDKMNFLCLAHLFKILIPTHRTVDIVEAILSGEIMSSQVRDRETDLGGLLISKIDVQKFLAPRLENTPESVPIVVAATHMKLKQEVLYHLVNKGLIRSHIDRINKRSARFLRISEIQKFQAKYESLADAARRCGIPVKCALSWARETRRRIVTGPTVDGGRQYFVLRT